MKYCPQIVFGNKVMKKMGVKMNNDLERFLIAQQTYYCTALQEIKTGQKCSHWIWFIFPQIAGLGYSETARYYAIKNMEEAKAYMEDYTLGMNLIEISEAILEVDSNDALEVMGWPDKSGKGGFAAASACSSVATASTSRMTCRMNGSLSSFSGSTTWPFTMPRSARASRMAMESMLSNRSCSASV